MIRCHIAILWHLTYFDLSTVSYIIAATSTGWWMSPHRTLAISLEKGEWRVRIQSSPKYLSTFQPNQRPPNTFQKGIYPCQGRWVVPNGMDLPQPTLLKNPPGAEPFRERSGRWTSSEFAVDTRKFGKKIFDGDVYLGFCQVWLGL